MYPHGDKHLVDSRSWSRVRLLVIFGVALLFFTSAIPALGQQLPEGRLMRFPDVYKDKIVFSYGGDLWLVASEGGVARRITTHPGQELFAKFSPDGKWIAFTAQYDGSYNIYVMSSEGGALRQLTYYSGPPLPERYGIHNQVITWTPDSRKIVFLSHRESFTPWVARLYQVRIEGGVPEPLPLDKGGLASFSSDGKKLAYNRIFRNFRTWKQYQGGMVQDISIYDLGTHRLEQMPHENWTDTFPMLHGNTIYFISDRGPEHRLNLYSYDMTARQIRQLTHFTDFDVNWPSLGSDAIVFENGGYLYVLDLNTGAVRKLTVYLPGEMDLARVRLVNVRKFISDFDISPDGKRAVFSARGDIFTVPAMEGSVRNITRTPGVREKQPAWSPDGHWIAYISDRTGEDELYIRSQDGLQAEQQVTSGGTMTRSTPRWSPDSSKLLFTDKNARLFYVALADGKPVQVGESKFGDITDYEWAPDSRWVVFARPAENGNREIVLYSLATNSATAATSDASDSWSPCFDAAGKYLYFLSSRNFNEVMGPGGTGFANPKPSRVYVTILRSDEPSPFPVRTDEVELPVSPDVLRDKPNAARARERAAELSKIVPSPATPGRQSAAEVHIDLAGLPDRTVGVLIPPGDLHLLKAASGKIFYVSRPIQGVVGPVAGEKPTIHVYDLKQRKDQSLLEGADEYALSADGRRLLYSAPGGGPQLLLAGWSTGGNNRKYGIIDAEVKDKPKIVGDGALSIDDMRMLVDPRAEWKQIFNEVWRLERDYFYSASMNGVDWDRQRQKYAQLLPHVADRFTLTYVMGELVGELHNSHAYVGGGDYPELQEASVGLLGADLEPDLQSGFYRIRKIYHGENWDAALRSPLTEPGVTVKEGDYILAVNGEPLRTSQNPDAAFVDTANRVVTISVSSKPDPKTAHNISVVPLADEVNLHELNWMETNRRKVDTASHGRIGYVYLADMSTRGLNAFVKQYFPQIKKEALIIDIRYNGGGEFDQALFEQLRKYVVGMVAPRNAERQTVPEGAFNGYLACITNHYAASDGDFFSYFFKKYQLGPLIGERTWGGVRGIRGDMPLMDGGFVIVPEFSLYGMDGNWLIENRGVEPDITVENEPGLAIEGRDQQLEKAIEVLMEKLEKSPRRLPARPPDFPAFPSGPGL